MLSDSGDTYSLEVAPAERSGVGSFKPLGGRSEWKDGGSMAESSSAPGTCCEVSNVTRPLSFCSSWATRVVVGGPAFRLRGIGVCDKHCFFNCKHLSQLVLLSDRKHFVLAEAHGTHATPCFCFLLALDASPCVEFSIIRLQGVRCTWLCGRGETIFAKADTRDVLRDCSRR